MRLSSNLPQQPKNDLETPAKEFCRKIRMRFEWLKHATRNPKSLRNARTWVHGLREKYHRARGDEFGGWLIQLADRVCLKVAEIVNLNPEDWDNRRRGQQFRRLDELLCRFEVELYRSRDARQQARKEGESRARTAPSPAGAATSLRTPVCPMPIPS